jgi:hypothetical protein
VSTSISATCPHCGESIEFDLRVRVATAAPALGPQFENAETLNAWLRASGFTIDEFRRVPLYAQHEEELEPLMRQLESRPA